MIVVFLNAGLVHVGAVDELFGREQGELAPHLLEGLVEFGHFKGGAGLAFAKMGDKRFEHGLCLLHFLVELGFFLQRIEAFFCGVEVGEQQFGFNGVHVAQRINAAVHMGDVFIVEAAHHFHDGGAFADVGQKLVAETFALAGPAHETGDVHEVHGGVDGFGGLHELGERVDALVGHGHGGLVGLDGAEGIVGGFGVLRLGERIEQGGLAHVGQTDDT